MPEAEVKKPLPSIRRLLLALVSQYQNVDVQFGALERTEFSHRLIWEEGHNGWRLQTVKDPSVSQLQSPFAYRIIDIGDVKPGDEYSWTPAVNGTWGDVADFSWDDQDGDETPLFRRRLVYYEDDSCPPPHYDDMTARHMQAHGSNFEQTIAEAFIAADLSNRVKIKRTWSDLWDQFTKSSMEDYTARKMEDIRERLTKA